MKILKPNSYHKMMESASQIREITILKEHMCLFNIATHCVQIVEQLMDSEKVHYTQIAAHCTKLQRIVLIHVSQCI